MLARDREDRIHVAGIAQHVNRHDGARPGRDPALDIRRVNVQTGVDLGKHRHQSEKNRGTIGGDERVSGHDYFVSWLQSDGQQTAHQRAGARTGGQGIRRAYITGKLLLEQINLPGEIRIF